MIWRHTPTNLRMPANEAPPHTLSIDDQPWMTDALCAQTDPEAFYPGKGGDNSTAKALCRRCDAQQACLEFALALPSDEDYGIWGGTSEMERRRIRRRRQKTCGACGQPFTPQTQQTLYCSDDCRRLAHRRQDEASRRRKRRRAS